MMSIQIQTTAASGVAASAAYWTSYAASAYGFISGVITFLVGILTIAYMWLYITKDPRVRKFFHMKGLHDEDSDIS